MRRDVLLALAFENASDGLLLMQADGSLIDCNPAALAMLACTHKKQVIGKRPTDFSPACQPDGRLTAELVPEILAQARATGSACFEWEHRRLDGEPLHVEALLTRLEIDDTHIFHIRWRDISRRRAAEASLAHRYALETLITNTSGYFINLPAEAIDSGVQKALGELGVFVDADRSYVFAYQDGCMNNLYEWCAEGITPQIDRMQGIPIEAMRWSNQRIRHGEILNLVNIDNLPPEAGPERIEFAAQGILSVLVVPMERRGQVVGFVGFDAVRQLRQWPDEVVDLLRMAAGIIANVLDRRDAELALHQTTIELEQRVMARTQELDRRRRVAESLRETLARINSNRPLEEVLGHIVRQANEFTGAAACVLYSMDRKRQTGRVAAGFGVLEAESEHIEFDLNTTPGQELLHIVSRREPIGVNYEPDHLDAIRNDLNADDLVRAKRAEVYARFAGSLSVPLFIHDQPYGAMLLYYDRPQPFSEQQIIVAATYAEQAALAIENARLYQAEQEGRQEAERRRWIAEGLREGLAVLNSDRPLADILDFVVQQAVDLLETGGGALYLLDDARELLRVGASYGLEAYYTALPIPAGKAITGRAAMLGEPVAVPDMQAAGDLLDGYLNEPGVAPQWTTALEQLKADYNALLSVPVQTPEQVYGALTLYYPMSQQFSDEVIGLAVAFAGQAALVIENAHLREHVRAMAVIEERGRLARDLHDAVTQTLFSASLIADTLPDLWTIDRNDAQQQLKRLGQLTRGALAEMRTLLIELRPARLAETDMGTLLQQLVDGARGRITAEIVLNVQGGCPLPPDVKIVLYRVAQEALNNIVKHARATHIYVSLRCKTGQAALQILDDGCGFDPGAVAAEHFGVQIMGERAASIGADFVLEAAPGEGTDIRLVWYGGEDER